MKIYANQLTGDLNKALRPVYLLTGDEPLQLMETGDQIIAAARKVGFAEKAVHHIDRSFDWGELYQAANSMSLFAEKKIIDLRFASAKPGDKGSAAIVEYCDNLSPDNTLIVRMPKLDKAAQNSKWFKALDKAGAVIQVWPVEIEKLPGWIQARAKSLGLTFSTEAAKSLAEKVEGNLLAAAQEIEKLKLNDSKHVSIEDLSESVAEATKFDIFKLSDAVLTGKSRRAVKILLGLKSAGEEPVLVLWALSKEIHTLIKGSAKLQSGKPMAVVFKEAGVWANRQAFLQSALQRLRSGQLYDCLTKAIEADKTIKGLSAGNVWDKLIDLSLMLSGKTIIKG